MARGGQAPRMRARARADHRSAERATDREVSVVAAVVATGSEKAAAHGLGLSHPTVKHHLANAGSKVGATTTAQLVWMLAERLPEPEPRALAHRSPSHPRQQSNGWRAATRMRIPSSARTSVSHPKVEDRLGASAALEGT